MRADQIERLKALSEKLADVVLEEADPDNWPGVGQAPGDMTQQERGDRYWCKKNAAATFALLHRAQTLTAEVSGDGGEDTHDLSEEIRSAEKMAAKALEAARKRSSGLVKRTQAGG